MRRLWVFFGMLFVGLVLWQGPAWGHGLKGFEAVEIRVTQDFGDPDDRKFCSLTKSFIKSAFSFPISGSKIKILDGAPVTIHVSIATLYEEAVNGCYSAIVVQAYIYEAVRLTPTNNFSFERIVLWENGYLLIGSREGHLRRVREKLEDFAKEFVVDWTAAQE